MLFQRLCTRVLLLRCLRNKRTDEIYSQITENPRSVLKSEESRSYRAVAALEQQAEGRCVVRGGKLDHLQ